jgi:hypothetical protein
MHEQHDPDNVYFLLFFVRFECLSGVWQERTIAVPQLRNASETIACRSRDLVHN